MVNDTASSDYLQSKEGTFCYIPGIKWDKEAHKEGPLFLLLLRNTE